MRFSVKIPMVIWLHLKSENLQSKLSLHNLPCPFSAQMSFAVKGKGISFSDIYMIPVIQY